MQVTIALLQAAAGSSYETNLNQTEVLIAQAVDRGAQIICTQELFTGLYFCREESQQNFYLAESIPGKTSQKLSEWAKRYQVYLIGSLFEKTQESQYFNTAIVFNPQGQLIHRYRKVHIPYDPNYYEKYYFKPGDLGLSVFETPWGKMGVLVCWDQWFPEAARILALQGARIIFYPTAIGWHEEDEDPDLKQTQLNAWQTLHASHAISNSIFVGAANRIGREPPLQFWGHSQVWGPFGECLSQANSEDACMVLAKCDLNQIEKQRKEWPFFRDRRTDLYHGLLEKDIHV